MNVQVYKPGTFLTEDEYNVWSNSKKHKSPTIEGNWRTDISLNQQLPPKSMYVDEFNHKHSISTSKSLDNTPYVSVKDVFYYVTLGGSVKQRDLIEIQEWVRRSVESHYRSQKKEWDIKKIYITNSRSFEGSSNITRINQYRPEHYPLMAKACINWATNHLNKIMY